MSDIPDPATAATADVGSAAESPATAEAPPADLPRDTPKTRLHDVRRLAGHYRDNAKHHGRRWRSLWAQRQNSTNTTGISLGWWLLLLILILI